MAMILNFSLPRSWSELSQKQLKFVLKNIVAVKDLIKDEAFSDEQDYANEALTMVMANCFYDWAGIKSLTGEGNNFILELSDSSVVVNRADLGAAAFSLRWLMEMPMLPTRLDAVQGVQAKCDANLQGLSLADFIACDNLWQGFAATRDTERFRDICAILFSEKAAKNAEPFELMSIFYWWASAKNYLASAFPCFFRPTENCGSDIMSFLTLRRNNDAIIRALTKGDISKNDAVLAADCWDAFAELDASAKECEDIEKMYGKQ